MYTDPLFDEDILQSYTIDHEAKLAYKKAVRQLNTLKRKGRIIDVESADPEKPYASHEIRVYLSNTCVGHNSMTVELPKELLNVLDLIRPYFIESENIFGLISVEGKSELDVSIFVELYKDTED